jgi:hypothetical protein
MGTALLYFMIYLCKCVVGEEGAWKLTESCPMAGSEVQAFSCGTKELVFVEVNKK